MGESMCVEGATAAAAFELYIEHFLAPTLGEGQVVVMDNLGAHRPKRIRELIEARGAELRWRRRSPSSPLLTLLDGSVIAATSSRFSTYEYRCKGLRPRP